MSTSLPPSPVCPEIAEGIVWLVQFITLLNCRVPSFEVSNIGSLIEDNFVHYFLFDCTTWECAFKSALAMSTVNVLSCLLLSYVGMLSTLRSMRGSQPQNEHDQLWNVTFIFLVSVLCWITVAGDESFTVDVTPSNVHHHPGHSLNLMCQYNIPDLPSVKKVTVRWQKRLLNGSTMVLWIAKNYTAPGSWFLSRNEPTIHAPDKPYWPVPLSFSELLMSHNLTINDVGKQDSGNYSCSVKVWWQNQSKELMKQSLDAVVSVSDEYAKPDRPTNPPRPVSEYENNSTNNKGELIVDHTQQCK